MENERKMVYVTMPVRRLEDDIPKMRRYCQLITKEYPDVLPVAPLLYFPQFTDYREGENRDQLTPMEERLLQQCEEIWIFDSGYSNEKLVQEATFALEHHLSILFAEKIFDRIPQEGIPSVSEDCGYTDVYGGELIAYPSQDPNYPGIIVSVRDGDHQEDLAVIEQKEDLLQIAYYYDLAGEEPAIAEYLYDEDYVQHAAYRLYKKHWKKVNKCETLTEDELEARGSIYVCFEEFLGAEYKDREFMKELLPERLFTVYKLMEEENG